MDRSLNGRRVRLIRCMDPYTNLPSGTLGTILWEDDAGTLHVTWETGSNLGLCYDDGDRWEVLSRWVTRFSSC